MTTDDPPAARSDVGRLANTARNLGGRLAEAQKRLDGHLIHIVLLWLAVAALGAVAFFG